MPSSTRGSGSGPSRQIRVVRALRGDGSGEETEQKTKTEKLGIGMPDQCVREDSRVLLERCDRLCVVVEVMSGFTTVWSSLLRSVRPAGVIHCVPGKNKTKAENKQRNSVSSWSRTKKSRCYSVKMLTRGCGKC